jgi:glycosyltransferase involved in cell wall biosynthesis
MQKHAALIQLYGHPNGANRGAGASRNLGIRNATGDLICFLDADDYWLPGRLDEAVSILETNTSLDGVYSPAIYRFETQTDLENFKNMSPLFGTTQKIASDQLFEKALNGETIFCTNGFIVRKNSLNNLKLFNESLRRGQDMEMILRMAASLKLVGTHSKKPVAVIRRHKNNRWKPSAEKDELQVGLDVFQTLYQWSVQFDICDRYRTIIIKRYFFLLGCAEQFSRVWKIACNIRRPWYVLYAWRYRIPGPRTVISLFRKFLVRTNN